MKRVSGIIHVPILGFYSQDEKIIKTETLLMVLCGN